MSEAPPLPGAKLKGERERRGLSAQKAADEMHLDRWVIDALEADDYERIGPRVYAKGHLRKYAALLGLPAAEILASYESGAPARNEVPSGTRSMMMSSRDDSPSARGLSPVPIAAGVVVLLLLAVLWWRPWHLRTRAPPSAQAAAIAAAAPATVPAAADASSDPSLSGIVSNTTAGPVAAPAATASPAADPGVAAADAAAAPLPGAGRARLRLSFSADSWVDVHDASGKRTFAGNGLANSVKTLSGLAPLRVYLGFGSGVQLEINDRAVAIGPQFFAGDVARFEAGADGVLRRDSHTDQPHAPSARNPRPPG